MTQSYYFLIFSCVSFFSIFSFSIFFFFFLFFTAARADARTRKNRREGFIVKNDVFAFVKFFFYWAQGLALWRVTPPSTTTTTRSLLPRRCPRSSCGQCCQESGSLRILPGVLFMAVVSHLMLASGRFRVYLAAQCTPSTDTHGFLLSNFRIKKVSTAKNCSDVGTKPVSASLPQQHCKSA